MRIGREGEDAALRFLKKHGYKILHKNYRTRTGEIDIIAQDGETIVFIEVKARQSVEYGRPFEAVNKAKRERMADVASLFLKGFKETPPCRFDVVSIIYKNGRAEFELFKDAFEV